MSKWQWIYNQLKSRLWLRASIFCALAILCALLSVVIERYLPEELSNIVGAQAVDSLLNILASSMLVVTTFSLSTMVSAYSAAASNTTPRATKLLLSDETSLNALSTFLGSFLFSLVGIITLKADIYTDSGRLILFIVTILLIFFITLTLLHWIEHLSKLGRVGHTIDTVETSTSTAFSSYAKRPTLGGNLRKSGRKPAKSHAIHDTRLGYIQYIDMAKLEDIAQKESLKIYIECIPGSFHDGVKPLFYVSKKIDEKIEKSIQSSFVIKEDRTFEQDPRYGMIVLAEIAIRALSPAVNDPGTAIEVIKTQMRLLSNYTQEIQEEAKEDTDIEYPNVYVPALSYEDLFRDAFRSIARDGAGMIEVGIALQKAMIALAKLNPDTMKKPATWISSYALKHVEKSLTIKDEKETLENLHKDVGK